MQFVLENQGQAADGAELRKGRIEPEQRSSGNGESISNGGGVCLFSITV
jgi:hypothetical protein